MTYLYNLRSLAAAILCTSSAIAAVLPGSDGKLDYGTDDLPVPPVREINMTPPRTVQLLGEVYAAKQPAFYRSQLLRELGETRLAPAVPLVVRGLADPDPLVQAAAAGALVPLAGEDNRSVAARAVLVADKSLRTTLGKMLASPAPAVRRAALKAVIAIEGPSSACVTDALSSQDPELISEALAFASTAQHGELIAQRLAKLPARSAAILAIGKCRAMSQREMLEKLAASTDIADAAAACDALGILASGDSSPVLLRLCDHAHPTIRRSAIAAMGQCAAPELRRKQSLAMLQDKDPSVQQHAAASLATAMSPDDAAILAGKLGHEYKPLYMAARAALSTQTQPAVRDACIQQAGLLLDHSNPRRQQDGSYVLGKYRSNHRLDRHIALAMDPTDKSDWEMVGQVIESLGLIGDPAAGPAVAAMVKRHKQPVGGQLIGKSLIAAGRLGAEEALPTAASVIKLDPLQSEVSDRAAAAFCIGAAGAPGKPGVNLLIGVLNKDSDPNKNETVKAIGNLRLKGGEKALGEFPMNESPTTQWLIQWATARLTGQPATHPPTSVEWAARTTHRDATPVP